MTALILAAYHGLNARRFWSTVAASVALLWGGHRLTRWGN